MGPDSSHPCGHAAYALRRRSRGPPRAGFRAPTEHRRPKLARVHLPASRPNAPRVDGTGMARRWRGAGHGLETLRHHANHASRRLAGPQLLQRLAHRYHRHPIASVRTYVSGVSGQLRGARVRQEQVAAHVCRGCVACSSRDRGTPLSRCSPSSDTPGPSGSADPGSAAPGALPGPVDGCAASEGSCGCDRAQRRSPRMTGTVPGIDRGCVRESRWYSSRRGLPRCRLRSWPHFLVSWPHFAGS